MKKFITIGLLWSFLSCFPSSSEQDVDGWKDLVRYPILMHYVTLTNQAQRPEIQNYIGFYLFGTNWKRLHLLVARSFVEEKKLKNIPSYAYMLTIFDILQQAQSQNRFDVKLFMQQNELPADFQWRW